MKPFEVLNLLEPLEDKQINKQRKIVVTEIEY